MGVRPSFKMSDVRAKLEADARKIEGQIINRLHELGLKCTNVARTLDTYVDQTGNLRSSVGYMIVRDGRILEEFFQTAKKDDEDRGKSTGRKLALELIAGNSKGYVLIVVAGMNYAAKVEMGGLDVLTSAEQYANKEFPKIMARLAKNIQNKK